MTRPSDAAKALTRSVDAQRLQREAAESSRRTPDAPQEEGVETPEQDRDE